MAKPSPSFTLIELVIVIGILAVLAAVVVIVINPAEYMKSARDSQRVSELQTITKAIGLYLGDGKTSIGSTNIVYVSIPDSSATCANLGLPALPGGWSYQCSTSANYRKADGTGWLPINFSSVSFTNPLQTLPVDPVNTTSTGNYYAYVNGGSFELAASMESSKYKLGGTNDKASKDGGAYPELYETGSNLTLLPVNYGDTSLVGYWKFDEGSGTTAYDASGHGNNGNLCNNGSICPSGGPSWATGKVGNYSLSFDGTGNYIELIRNLVLNKNTITLAAWFKTTDLNGAIISHYLNSGYYSYKMVVTGGKLGVCVGTISTDCASFVYLSTSSVAVNDDAWHQSVVSYDGAVVKLYLDGSQVGSANKTGNIAMGYYLHSIGVSGFLISPTVTAQDAGYLNGIIDDVRIYNRALTAAEVSALYTATNK